MIDQVKQHKAQAASHLCVINYELGQLREQVAEKERQLFRIQGELSALSKLEQLHASQDQKSNRAR